MSGPAHELAAALASYGVTAVPEGDSVRAWIGGTGTSWVPAPSPQTTAGGRVWLWRREGKTGSHPRGNIPGAAAKLTRFVAGNPP
ncbi:MAG TPA: hypothetical protein VF933_21410 [Streptosporangiaceae bacterium]